MKTGETSLSPQLSVIFRRRIIGVLVLIITNCIIVFYDVNTNCNQFYITNYRIQEDKKSEITDIVWVHQPSGDQELMGTSTQPINIPSNQFKFVRETQRDPTKPTYRSIARDRDQRSEIVVGIEERNDTAHRGG